MYEGEDTNKCPYCNSELIVIYSNEVSSTKEEIDKLNENTREVKMAKETITEIRITNANKVLDFIKTLEVEDKQVTKILCRASRIFKESKK